jgi:hypothetical protein
MKNIIKNGEFPLYIFVSLFWLSMPTTVFLVFLSKNNIEYSHWQSLVIFSMLLFFFYHTCEEFKRKKNP